MVECARLEIAYTGNRIKGSNPFVSARNYTASRYFLLNYQPFYDIIVRNNRTPTRPYFLSRPRDFFIYQKETNMKRPEFLTKLITSPAYADKNSDEFARATQYINLLYPGKINFDISGAMIQPKYDMTLEQFQTAQFKLDSDFESAKQEAEDEIQTEYGEYFENLGIDFDIDKYVIQPEIIAVKVLYPSGNIITRNLIIYDLDIPKFTKKTKIWRWHNEQSDSTCDECDALDETIFFNESDIPDLPAHPNCRCWVEEIEFDEKGNVIRRSQFAGNRPSDTDRRPDENNQNAQKANSMSPEKNNDQIREESIRKTMAEEGGYIDNPNRIDQPTNSGITQPTLNTYNQRHPEADFPENVRELTGQQAEQIYTELYYNDRNIGNIENPRIAHAIFDMGVMSSYSNVGRIVQNTINETQGTNLAVDGDIGARTIQALNNIPENQVDRFMEVLIENRIEYLKTLADWDRYGRGWTARTNRY